MSIVINGSTGISGVPAGGYNLVDGDMPSGAVLQVVQGTTSTVASTTSTAYTNTNLSVSIIPFSTSSKILVMAKQKGCRLNPSSGEYGMSIALLRDSTIIWKPGPSIGHHSYYLNNVDGYGELDATYLDSPATTSSVTYKTQFASYISGKTVYVQQGNNFTSVIIAMEIAA